MVSGESSYALWFGLGFGLGLGLGFVRHVVLVRALDLRDHLARILTRVARHDLGAAAAHRERTRVLGRLSLELCLCTATRTPRETTKLSGRGITR